MNAIKFKRSVVINIIILFLGIVMAFMLLVIVYAMPSGRVENNVRDSLQVLWAEGDYYCQIAGKTSTKLDNFADVYYLQMCFIKGSKGVIDNALSSYGLKYVSDACSPLEDLTAYFNGTDLGVYPRETRFWNGYVVILKPLLYFTNYGGIRNLNIILQTFLMFYICTLLKRYGGWYSCGLILTWLAQNPFTISANLFYSSIWYSTLVPMAVMLKCNDWIKRKNLYSTFFLLLGMETVFFNMNSSLCMPLGMCMILYMVLNGFEGNLLRQIRDMLCKGIAWLTGSLGLWSSKWILTGLFTENYSVTEAFQIMSERTSADLPYSDEAISRMDVISRNMRVLTENKWCMVALLIFALLGLIYTLSRIMSGKLKESRQICFCAGFWFLVFTAMPYVWYCFMPSHSYMHCHFTYRTLAIGVFSFTCGIAWFVEHSNSKFSALSILLKHKRGAQ